MLALNPSWGNGATIWSLPASLRLNRAFWMEIRQPESGETRDYLRWLDLLTGKVTVQWENEAGALLTANCLPLTREMWWYSAFSPPRAHSMRRFPFRSPVKKTGFFNGITHPELCRHELEITGDLITLKWAYCPDYGQKGYVSVVRFLRSGGKTEPTEHGIRVSDADSLIILSKNHQVRERLLLRMRRTCRLGNAGI